MFIVEHFLAVQIHQLVSELCVCVCVCVCVVSCQCNGHSDICDKDRGDNCDCQNNTKSPRCETSEMSISACWKFQVTQLVKHNTTDTDTAGHATQIMHVHVLTLYCVSLCIICYH